MPLLNSTIKRLLLCLLSIGLFPAQGFTTTPDLVGHLSQGGLVIGQAPQGIRVFYGDRPLQIDPNGYFIIGFSREASEQQQLSLLHPDGSEILKTIRIQQRTYQTERIDGIKKKMMEPSAEELVRIQQEALLAHTARQFNTPQPFFREPFIWPLKGRITGVYGSQRILNGKPRRPHFGIDIAAPTGTEVKAPAGGIVTLAHQGMFFSGKTLIIDHGHGLSSSFLHLSRIRVKQGEKVDQGQLIAEVGASGRVTGPHLDWRVNWFDQRLDPAFLVPAMKN